MVHRTDIAGSVGCDRGQVRSGPDRMRGHAAKAALGINGALIEKSPFSEVSARSCFGGTKCSRRFMTAIPSVHAVDVDARGPVKRHYQKHHKGRDGNAIGQP